MTASATRLSSRRLAALVRKEAMQILRDPSTFLIAFVLPMILLFLFGYAVSLDSSRTRIGVVLEDSSGPALRLAQAYQTSRYFDVTMARTIQPVREAMVAGDLRAIIVMTLAIEPGTRK